MALTGSLNVFQRAMLLWSQYHPYNAVHVVKVPQLLEAPRLTGVIRDRLEQIGLTGFVLDGQKGRYQYRGGPASAVLQILDGDGEAEYRVCRETEAQLNSPFQGDGELEPFRFFAVSDADAFYLGLVYFHCVSGAESIILLLKDIVGAYTGCHTPCFSSPVDLYPQCRGGVTQSNGKELLKAVRNLPSLLRGLRRSFRPHYQDFNDLGNGFLLFRQGPLQFQALARRSKEWGLTLNDLFLALMLKAVSPLAQGRFAASRRKLLSVGSIVNIRKDFNINSRKTFGLFLGSFTVSHPVSEGISLERLARDIQEQTARIKNEKSYLLTARELMLVRLILPFFSSARHRKFYPKYHPLWGGLTNINLNTLWPNENGGGPDDYFRAVSTGPVVPMVFSITTVKDSINIGVSYRTTVFSKTDVDLVVSGFSSVISTLEGKQ